MYLLPVFFFIFHICVKSTHICLSPSNFSQYDSFQFHLCCNKRQDFIFFISMTKNLLYVCMIFIYSYLTGHLGYFQILAIVYSTSMNIGLHIFLHFVLCSLQEWIARSYTRSNFNILRSILIIYYCDRQVYILTNSKGGFLLFYTTNNLFLTYLSIYLDIGF